MTRSLLERSTIQGESPVEVNRVVVRVSRVLYLEIGVGIWGALISKTKYVLRPIAYQYREGTLKRTRSRVLKDLKSSSYSMLGPLGVLACFLNKGPGSVLQWQG